MTWTGTDEEIRELGLPTYCDYVDVFHKDLSFYDCRVCEVGCLEEFGGYFQIKTDEGRVSCFLKDVKWNYSEGYTPEELDND